MKRLAISMVIITALYSCVSTKLFTGKCIGKYQDATYGTFRYVFRSADSTAIVLKRSFSPYLYNVRDTYTLRAKVVYNRYRDFVFFKRKKLK